MDLKAAFIVLEDEQVQMGITVQLMTMRANTGELEVRLPVHPPAHLLIS